MFATHPPRGGNEVILSQLFEFSQGATRVIGQVCLQPATPPSKNGLFRLTPPTTQRPPQVRRRGRPRLPRFDLRVGSIDRLGVRNRLLGKITDVHAAGDV